MKHNDVGLLQPLQASLVPDIPRMVEQARQLLSDRTLDDAVLIASVSTDLVIAEASERAAAPKGATKGYESPTPAELVLEALQDDPGLQQALSLVGVGKARPSECLAAVAWSYARSAHQVTQVPPSRPAGKTTEPSQVSARYARDVMEMTLRLAVLYTLWAAEALAQAYWCRRLEALLPEEMVTAPAADFATSLQQLLERPHAEPGLTQPRQALHARHEQNTRPLQAMVLARYERKYRALLGKKSRANIAEILHNCYGQPKVDTIDGYLKQYEKEAPLSPEQLAVRNWVVQEASVRSFSSESEVKSFAQQLAPALASRVPPAVQTEVHNNSAYYSAPKLLFWMLVGYPADLLPPLKPETRY